MVNYDLNDKRSAVRVMFDKLIAAATDTDELGQVAEWVQEYANQMGIDRFMSTNRAIDQRHKALTQ